MFFELEACIMKIRIPTSQEFPPPSHGCSRSKPPGVAGPSHGAAPYSIRAKLGIVNTHEVSKRRNPRSKNLTQLLLLNLGHINLSQI